MPAYDIEMLWECSHCQTLGNLGLSRHCTRCGWPKGAKDREYFPDDISVANAIRDAEKQKLSGAGKDWKCKYCASLQNETFQCCSDCGCDKSTGIRNWDSGGLEVSEDANRSNRVVVETLPSENLITAAPSYAPPAPKPIRYVRAFPWWKVAAVFGACSVVALLYFLFRTIELNSGVRSVAWTHKVSIDRIGLVPHDGWSPPPDGVEVSNLGPRFHYFNHMWTGYHMEPYNDPQPCGQTCGARPACYTTPTNCSRRKNGTASCSGGDRICPSPSCHTKYCPHTAYRRVDEYTDIPVNDPYYSWKSWEWQHNRDAVHSGVTTQTDWPNADELHLDQQFERANRSEEYKVVLGHHGKLWDFVPKSDEEFRLYPVGSRHEIRVNAIGQITIVRHGR